MATYKCLTDLQGKTLEFGDIVILKNIKHDVCSRYLHEEHHDNDKIFSILSISSKEDFASNAYGYECRGGAWPECERNDYEALTRLVIELYKTIESQKTIAGFKIKGLYLRQLDVKEARKLLRGYNVCFDDDKWALDSRGWYYWNTQDFQLRFEHESNSHKLESRYQDITPSDNPNQWYKITTPGESGISPEEVKALITKYGGRIDPNLTYTSRLGVYIWTKNEKAICLSKGDVREDAIEVSPTTEITTIKKEEKHEGKFQRKKTRVERGTRPEGSTVRGRRGKIAITVGHLSNRKVTGI